MKILMFSYLPPVISGVASYTQNLCRQLIKQGHEVELISFHEKNKGEYVHEGVKVHGFPSLFNVVDMYALDSLVYLPEVIKLVKKIKPDIIHFHHRTSTIEFAMEQIKKETKCPIVNTVHSAVGSLETFDIRDAAHFIHYKMLSDVLRKNSDMVISVSQFNKKYLVLNGLPPEKVKVIKNGVPVEKFEGVSKEVARKNLGFKDDEEILLFVGRHLPEKGLDFLIYAFNKIWQKHKKAKLVIVGEGPLTFIYKFLASGNKNIIFPGKVSWKTLVEYYKAADIFVLPSVWHEPFGIVSLEAMAAKLPIVATSTGGTTELIKECNSGILVKPRSADELAKGIEILLENKELREKLAENGYKKVISKFTWDKIAKQVIDVYNLVLKK